MFMYRREKISIKNTGELSKRAPFVLEIFDGMCLKRSTGLLFLHIFFFLNPAKFLICCQFNPKQVKSRQVIKKTRVVGVQCSSLSLSFLLYFSFLRKKKKEES